MTRARLVLLVALLIGFALAGPAGAHSQVRDATPGPAETVTAPLDSVVLEFLDPVVPTPTIEVTAPDGTAVAGLGEVRLEGDDVARVDFDDIDEPGQYRVDYSFVALDGDEQSSAYTFTLEEAPGGVAVRPLLAVFVGAVLVLLLGAALRGRRRSNA